MKGFAATAAALVVAATSFTAIPASAQGVSMSFGQQRDFVEDRCDMNPNWRGCDDFRRHHGNWDRDDYGRWYQWNRASLGTIGFGLFAFAIGAAAANAAEDDYDRDYGDDDYAGDFSDDEWADHVDRCEAQYRSYDRDTDMYLSYHNGYQRCLL
jgi:hypothetical protein